MLFHFQYIQEHRNQGYGNVTVWGGIIGGRKTGLVRIQGRLNAEQYIEQVLVPHVFPLFQNEQEDILFMQDNAPPHRARLTLETCNENNV